MMYFLHVLVYFSPISPNIKFLGKKDINCGLFSHEAILFAFVFKIICNLKPLYQLISNNWKELFFK